VTSAAVRSKQVRAAELVGTGLTYAEAGAIVGRSERTVARWLQDPDLRALAAREGAVPGDVGPVEILRAALLATKASGQPDWPTRVSAARTLAALRPEEVEPKTEHDQPAAPSIVVYDLPPGADPVLHRALNGGAAAPVSALEAPSEHLPTSNHHTFIYQPADGESDDIGMWSPAGRERSPDPDAVVKVVIHSTDDRETAELWRAELAAGRLPPVSTESVP
jgi:hypothetical protein